jgi:hypothetical protein
MHAATGGGTVFGRRQVKTQTELMREEFGEGFDHLRMAAAHAAGTAAGLLAPRLDAVRERLEPTYDKSKHIARDSARRAGRAARRATGKKESRMAKRWPMVVGGLMIAGAAAGVAGALLSRRRQRRWNDYGTTGSMSGYRDETRSFTDTARSTAASVADSAKEKTSDVLGQMKGTTETTGAGSSSPSPQSTTSARPGDFSAKSESAFKSGTAGATSRNGRQ